MTAQNIAADPKRSAWVSANAGAGKTYTLANRVTRLLLDGAKPGKILCLTYTKAAAAEMAGRLFDQLGKWAMADDSDLARRIAEIGAETRDAQGLREARTLFALALETPGGLKIQTIHSFCQYLLARFPVEAGVPPSFRVLDDASARELTEAARARVLERAGHGERALAEAAAALVTETSEISLQAVLGAAFGSERRKLEQFLARVPEAERLGVIAAAHGARTGDSADALAAQFVAEMKSEEKFLRRAAAWLGDGGVSDQRVSQKLLRAVAESSFAAFMDLFFTQGGKPRARLATNALSAAEPQLHTQLEAVATRFSEVEARRRAAHASELAQAAIVLVEACSREYAHAKRARSTLDYDDLIMATKKLLEKRAAAQWVLYKLDGGLDHVLIDEAQDTSPEQWAIVKRLTEEFFAGEGADRGTRNSRTIFAVGDEKQSIFSFQGAEPREFDIHRRYFAERIGAEAFADVRLEVSRRSVPEVLRFVDEIFSKVEAREGVVSGEEQIAHRASRAGARGRVELWPLLSPSEQPEPDPWRPVDVPSEASPSVTLAEQIATRIAEWTDGTKCLPGKSGPVRPGDIMVLMPRREPFAGAVIRALKMRGIPVAGADRIRLASQIVVMDLIALGRFALLPEDDLNLAVLLRSPLVGFSEDELFSVCEGRKGRTLWHEMAARQDCDPECAAAFAFLSEILSRADFAPPYEFYASLLARNGVRKNLLTRLGADATDSIDEFLSLALAFEQLNTPSLEAFLHWIQHGEAEVKRDMDRGRDEVRVMTVHGAKGLEADIVILPDTAGAPGGLSHRSEFHYVDGVPVFPVKAAIAPEAVRQAKIVADRRAREEHRRLLYVALTRARDRLYVCGFKGRSSLNMDSWYALAERAAQDIGVAVARGDQSIRALGDGEFVAVPAARRGAAESFALEAWMQETAPIERARPRLIRPSDASGTEEPNVQSPAGLRHARRFRRGNLVHALLARLPEIGPLLRHASAEKYLSAQGVGRDEAENLIAETLAVLDHPDFAAAFAPDARAEVAIVADLPEIAEGARVNGRIDRLAVSGNRVLVVDFKTNRPPPACPDDVPKLYIAQMALYRAALTRIFPEKTVASALLWTDGPSLMHLDDARLDREIMSMRARLDPQGGGS